MWKSANGSFHPLRALAIVAKLDTSGDAKPMDEAEAKRLIDDHLKNLPLKEGWTYAVVSSREHPLCWAFGIQPLNPKGQPSYDIHSFEVDKRTAAVTQSTTDPTAEAAFLRARRFHGWR